MARFGLFGRSAGRVGLDFESDHFVPVAFRGSLTASLVMMLTFIGVLLLRGAVNDPNRRATWTGVATIVAYLNIPITYMSVRWWASMHQQQSTPATMNDEMKFVMRMCAWAFLLLSIWFMARRWRVAKLVAESEMPEPLTIGQNAQEAR